MTAGLDSLAVRAREILATAGGGTLHIAGVGDLGDDAADVVLYDDGGIPTFVGPTGCAVVDAAVGNRAAVLTVHAHSGELTGTSVVLAGRLVPTGRERVDGTELVVVALRLATVLVEHDDPTASVVNQVEIPVHAYREAAPDPLTQAARRIIRHSNVCHGAQLRQFVADLRGVTPGAIAAAELVDVDSVGLVLGWVDQRGSHTARFVYPTPAGDPDALADRVRDTLVGSRG